MTSMRIVVCWFIVIAFINSTASSYNRDKLEPKNVSLNEELDSDFISTNRSPVVPIEEPDLSDDEVEVCVTIS